MSLSETEYAELRATIRTRGTVRVLLTWATLVIWASLTVVASPFGRTPLAGGAALAILVAGFEAVAALHFGVERIGRYLQVFYEVERDVPRWELTAMAFGPGLPGAGSDPLLSWAFAAAAVLNVLTVQNSSWQPLVLVAHALFGARVALVRLRAGRQRAADLARFQELKDTMAR
jgi:hypothetical protein